MDFEKIDIINSLQPLVDRGGWHWRADSMKLDRVAAVAETRTPWIYWYTDPAVDCYFANDVLFAMFGIIPTVCANCYKVVAIPNSVVDLMAICDLQSQIKHSSKCGIEVRDDVARNYGAYWYNQGLESGKICYELIRELVSKYVGPDVRVGLKRGCTEYERKFGRSDAWTTPPGQAEFEEMVRALFHDPPAIQAQTELFRRHIKDRWIRFAYSRGDMTYLRFTDGVPLFEPYVLYAGAL